MHPISINGIITRFIGLVDNDASPINENERCCEDNNPVNNREVVPELPQSIGCVGFSNALPFILIVPSFSSIETPHSRIALIVECKSSPSFRFVI